MIRSKTGGLRLDKGGLAPPDPKPLGYSNPVPMLGRKAVLAFPYRFDP